MKNYFFKITLLILAFCIIIGGTLYLVIGRDNYFDKNSAHNLTQFLAKNGVIVEEALIDTKTQYVMNTELKSVTSDKASLSYSLLGDNLSVLAETYTSSLGTVSYMGSEFNFKPASEYRPEITKDADKYDANKKAQRLLKTLGFNLDGSIISNATENDTIHVTVTKTVEGLPVFDDVIRLSMNKLGTISINGRWYYDAGPLNWKRPSKTIVDALIELMNNTAENVQIVNIQLGYLLKDTSSDISILRPVWQFKTDSGEFIYIGA